MFRLSVVFTASVVVAFVMFTLGLVVGYTEAPGPGLRSGPSITIDQAPGGPSAPACPREDSCAVWYDGGRWHVTPSPH